MGKTVDYYKILGISIFASQEEIKAGYIKKMKEYHPDAYQGNKKEAENISAEINQGYEILSDPKQKFVYDQKYGFDAQRARIEKEQAKQKRKQERREKRKNKHQQKANYTQEKMQAKEAKEQEEFNKATAQKDKKIKTNFFTKKVKKDTKVVHPFAKTPEEKQVRKERLILDITIIALLVVVILLILFK